jgi:hypothetical protein
MSRLDKPAPWWLPVLIIVVGWVLFVTVLAHTDLSWLLRTGS